MTQHRSRRLIAAIGGLALTISGGDLSIFTESSLSLGLLGVAALFLIIGLRPNRSLAIRDD